MTVPPGRVPRRVVVAGAGFAGVKVAQAIERHCDVTLVAPSEKFVYLPLVHEVASDNVLPTEVTRELAEILPRTTLVHSRASRVEGNDLVTTGGDRIPFDALVVAVGAESADYGVPGVREHALTFYSLGDALRANGTLKVAAANARGRPVRVVVVGASFTGVEVAGEAAALLDDLDVPREIVLFDALPVLFPRQAPRFREEVHRGLDRLDLKLRTGVTLAEVRSDGVVYREDGREGFAPSDVTFWCAGVRSRGVEGVDPAVRPTLRSASRDDVLVVGDAARFPKDLNVPKLAQTAEDQAAVAAWNLLHPGAEKEYHPAVKGLIVSIGHNYAVAEIAGGAVFSGTVPWHVKRLLYKAKIAFK